MTSFQILVNSIIVRFTCPQCGEKVKQELYNIPIPNGGADTASDSENSDDEDLLCDNCGHEFRAEIYANMYEGNVEIIDAESNDVIENVEVEVNYEEDNE